MGETLERYDLDFWRDNHLTPDSDGEWVRADAALARIAALEAEVASVKAQRDEAIIESDGSHDKCVRLEAEVERLRREAGAFVVLRSSLYGFPRQPNTLRVETRFVEYAEDIANGRKAVPSPLLRVSGWDIESADAWERRVREQRNRSAAPLPEEDSAR